MNKIVAILLGLVGWLILVIIIAFGWGVGIRNEAQAKKIQYEAKVSSNKAELNNLKKKLSDYKGITDTQIDALTKIFVDYANARTNKSQNLLVNWVKESVPNVDQSTFKEILNLVTGTRDSWTARQTELVDIARAYNTLLTAFPNNVLLNALGYTEINPKVITSTSVEKAFDTGKDDEPSPFSKK
jgi:hypothetical protein